MAQTLKMKMMHKTPTSNGMVPFWLVMVVALLKDLVRNILVIFGSIWVINTLFSTAIAYSFLNFLAGCVAIMILSAIFKK